MEQEFQRKIPQDKELRAYQKEKMWKGCNSVFPLDDQTCTWDRTCILHVVHSNYKLEYPEVKERHNYH